MVNSKKHERICPCQKTYFYCNSCSEYDHLEPWHLRWCSSNCKDIDTILSNWGAKMISSKEAAEQLSHCDMSRINLWPKGYQDAYKQIMEEVGTVEKQNTLLDELIERESEHNKKHSETEKIDEQKQEHTLSISEEVKSSSKKKTSKARVTRTKDENK